MLCFLSQLSLQKGAHIPQEATAEMDWCRLVGPHGLCRPLDESQAFPTNTPPLAACEGRSKHKIKKKGTEKGP